MDKLADAIRRAGPDPMAAFLYTIACVIESGKAECEAREKVAPGRWDNEVIDDYDPALVRYHFGHTYVVGSRGRGGRDKALLALAHSHGRIFEEPQTRAQIKRLVKRGLLRKADLSQQWLRDELEFFGLLENAEACYFPTDAAALDSQGGEGE